MVSPLAIGLKYKDYFVLDIKNNTYMSFYDFKKIRQEFMMERIDELIAMQKKQQEKIDTIAWVTSRAYDALRKQQEEMDILTETMQVFSEALTNDTGNLAFFHTYKFYAIMARRAICDLSKLKELEKNGFDLSFENGALLPHACLINSIIDDYRRLYVVKYLIEEKNIDINAHNGEAIYNSIISKAYKLTEYLIQSGADLNYLYPLWRDGEYHQVDILQIAEAFDFKDLPSLISKLSKPENKRFDIIASSIFKPALKSGGGFLYIEGKGDVANIENIVSLAERYNRTNDVCTVDSTDFISDEGLNVDEESIKKIGDLIRNDKIVLVSCPSFAYPKEINVKFNDVLNLVVKNHLDWILDGNGKRATEDFLPYHFIYSNAEMSDEIKCCYGGVKDVCFVQAGDVE